MFALWAAVCRDCFDAAASVSGSLWYDGFANFVCEAGQLPERVYLSVGDRECRARNSAFQRIEDCTQRIEAHLRRKGVDVIFEHNPGGHFDDPLGRMERAIRWLLREGSRR